MVTKEDVEKARRELIRTQLVPYYDKSVDIKDMIQFLKTYCDMPYHAKWFLSDISRLRGIYEKEYKDYFKKYIESIREYAQAEERYLRLKKRYDDSLENEKAMREVYKINGGA